MLNSRLSVPHQVTVPRDVPQYDPNDPQGSLQRLLDYIRGVMPRLDDMGRATSAVDRALSDDVRTLNTATFQPMIAVRYSDFTVQDTAPENIYLVSTAIGPITATLPRSEPWRNRMIVLTKASGDANNLIIRTSDGLVTGAASVSFGGAYGSRSFVCDGINWWAVGS